MKFSLSDAYEFGWDGLKGRAYNSSDDFPGASAAYFEVSEKGHGRVRTTLSDRVYYIMDGQGEFVINGKTTPVTATDVVIVPKNTPYDYRAADGTVLKLFLVHAPAYDATKEVKLKPATIEP